MSKELKYLIGWMCFALLSGILAGPLLHIPHHGIVLVVMLGLSSFASGIFFTLSAHESVHPIASKKQK